MNVLDLAKRIHTDTISRFRWTSDAALFGKAEYWHGGVIERDGILYGDCDDYALECFSRLYAEGVPLTDLLLCACLQDEDSAEGLYDHAILLVKHGADYYVMDNCMVDVQRLQDVGYHAYYVPSDMSDVTRDWVKLEPA